MLDDIPGNGTILKAKLSFVDEQDHPVNISNGIYIARGKIAPQQHNSIPLMDCEDHRGLAYDFQPVIIAEQGLRGGPQLYTAPDGSDISVGFWAQKYGVRLELEVQAVSLDPIRNRTILAKVELDFVASTGRPRRSVERQTFKPDACQTQLVVKTPNKGPKSYVSKTTQPMVSHKYGDILSFRKFPFEIRMDVL